MCTVSEASSKTGIYRIVDNIHNLRIRAMICKATASYGSGAGVGGGDGARIDRAPGVGAPGGRGAAERARDSARSTGLRYEDTPTQRPQLQTPNTILQKQFHWKNKNEKRKNEENSEGNCIKCFWNDEYQPNEMSVTTGVSPEMTLLQKEMLKLKLEGDGQELDAGGKAGSVDGVDIKPRKEEEEFDLKKTLEKCIKEPFYQSKLETMYIVADLGKMDSETRIWLKSEHLLCTLKYDQLNKKLYVYPDFTKNINHPYTIEIGGDTKIVYEYYIENISNEKSKQYQQKEQEVLQKIIKRNRDELNQIIGTDFLMPARNSFRVHLFFEISTAKGFEYDDIYVQYNVELPELWKCDDEKLLCGSTQTCKTKGFERVAHFGHSFDLTLEYNVKDLEKDEIPRVPYIYFQIISRDYWDRYRCEGISYKAIPVFQPGIQKFELQCIRVCPKTSVGDMRRYFIGDYGSIDDISWIGLPKDYEDCVINKFGVRTIGTGTIQIKLNIINQSKQLIKTFGQSGDFPSIQLVKSVEEVVSAFKKAQERMQKARRLVLERKKLKENIIPENTVLD